MGRLNPEQKVQSACEKRLDIWELKKVVIHYDDLSNAGRKFVRGYWIMNTKEGRPDLVAYLKHKNQCWIYLIEVKRPDGGVWSEVQKVYANKFSGLDNVVYEVVTHPRQIDATIERITNHYQDILDIIS